MNLCIARIGTALVAVDGDTVRRVAAIGAVTPLPRSPHHLIGLVADRHRILTLLDPLRSLGETAPHPPGERMIVCRSPLGEIGLRVDAVLSYGPLDIDPSEADPHPLVDRRFHHAGEPCRLLDIAALAARAARSTEDTSSHPPPSPT